MDSVGGSLTPALGTSVIFLLAGGREVYSQSKARSARHKNRQRHSGEFHPPGAEPGDTLGWGQAGHRGKVRCRWVGVSGKVVQVLEGIGIMRAELGTSTLEQSAVGDSQANGYIERAVR